MKILICILIAGITACSQTKPLAVIDGQSLYDQDLSSSFQAQMRQLHNQEYELKRRALEDLINQKLLAAEAKKRGISAEALLQEIDAKVSEPSDAEVEAFYLGQKDRINRPLDDIRSQLRQMLKQTKLQQARQDYAKRLREKAKITIFLQPPRVEMAWDAQRMRGNPKAPVTIVEFSDFQCPYCRSVQPTLKEVMAKYGDRVRLAFRDYPLSQIHGRAEAAAEAARCAGEQGKFWQYHDLVFANQSKLDAGSLAGHARTLNLDQKQFDACLATGKFRSKVEEDVQDGTKAGVSGTPAFFVNGVFLNGAVPASDFEQVIEDELREKAH